MELREFLPHIQPELSSEGALPGRKFLMGRYALLLATLGFLATALSSVLSLNFMTFIGGLGTLFAIYCGGNVGQKLATSRPTTITQVVADRRKAAPAVESFHPEDGPGPAGG